MSNFIQLHFLTSYPPANLNRDDLGRPKTAIFGNAMRLRISSQSLKRAWRSSQIFEKLYTGKRTKIMGNEIYNKFIQGSITEPDAKMWAINMIRPFIEKPKSNKKDDSENSTEEKGKQKKDTKKQKLETEQLIHFSCQEIEAINRLIDKVIASRQAPNVEEIASLLKKEHQTIDIACFGRMLANNPACNTEAAVQVAHAISVHKVAIEDDFFTAVDDLNAGLEDSGAAHLGETEFAAGLFYEYICIDRDELKKNLQGNEELTQKTIAALIEAAATVAPSGKQNSFASRARASYALAEKGTQQPRSLVVAFLKPVKDNDMLQTAIKNLTEQREKMDLVYGACSEQTNSFNVEDGHGSLKDLINFAKTE